jgi:nitrile hydratase subunit beta
MNGPHDVGGMHGFGPVHPEADEPPFHAAWERRAFALTLAMGATGSWNLDTSRSARESLPPVQYLSSSYFEIWLAGLLELMMRSGLVSAEEVAAGRSLEPAAAVPRVLFAANVEATLARGSPTERPVATSPRFSVGDRVRTRMINPATHTRLPRYVRGRPGKVLSVHGAHVYPDSHALGEGEQPQWLYTLRFDAHDLWGEDTTASSVCVDCWEPYLERA